MTSPDAGGAAHDATAHTDPGPPVPEVVDAETVRRHDEEADRAHNAVRWLREKAERIRAHLRATEEAIPAHQADADAAARVAQAVRAKFEQGNGAGA
jgi:hypothetical protein